MTILRELRVKKGITTKQVVAALGISDSYLSQLETGHSKNPAKATLYALAKFYEVELKDILDESGNLKPGDPKYKTFKKPVKVQIGDLFTRITELEGRVSFLTEVVESLSRAQAVYSLRVPEGVRDKVNGGPLDLTPKHEKYTGKIDPNNPLIPIL